MTIERICPICHRRMWKGYPPKWRNACEGHNEAEIVSGGVEEEFAVEVKVVKEDKDPRPNLVQKPITHNLAPAEMKPPHIPKVPRGAGGNDQEEDGMYSYAKQYM